MGYQFFVFSFFFCSFLPFPAAIEIFNSLGSSEKNQTKYYPTLGPMISKITTDE